MQAIENRLIKGTTVVVGDTQAPFTEAVFRGALTAATDTTVGGVLKLSNDTGYDLWVTLFLANVTTKSTGAATVDIGVDDLGDTSNDTLLDGLDVGTAAIVASNVVGGGTHGNIVKWPKGYFLTGTASATLAGMVGTYLVKAIPV